MKFCRKCKISKSLSEFYKKASAKDGLQSWCKHCKVLAQRRFKSENPEVCKGYWRRYSLKNTSKLREQSLAYHRNNPHRIVANNAVTYAIKTGSLAKEPCFICGDKGEAHHSSYDRDMFLAVTWLCRAHHWQVHREASSAAVAKGSQ